MVSLTYPDELVRAEAQLNTAPGQVHVAIDGLFKRYPGQAADALSDINLEIKRGEIFGIIGRSGAGKSSLIRCLNRLEDPSAGKVLIDGVDIGALSASELVSWRRRTGMIFQHFNLLSAKTVRQNIELPMQVAGIPKTQRQRKADQLLALVGLQDRQHAFPAQLSGGQKQRVGIARALVHDPQLLLCDEATSALDPETTRSILALLRDINRQRGITIVLITHEMDVIHDLCHQVVVLDGGKVIERGPVWQVYGDPQHVTTRLLLNPQIDNLPEFISERLSAQPSALHSRQLWCLRYTGQGAQPDLAAINTAIGEGATLIQTALEWVQGKQIGQILLLTAAETPALSVEHIPSSLADRVEVLGYVAAN
ncbi:methionine ABC transporter ATP-binding protein [Rouxiella sp. Mn2063]|uniref:methionine ABC transporter ATP-binding protein n=1 Tax=Rouxiella sp. Mn2063 TaxID=3395262 RepID=UPI003BD57015